MSLKDTNPGTYKAVIAEGAWLNPGDKTPSVGIQFQFEREPGKLESITHFLYLSEKARPYTMDKLVELGYDFTKALKVEDGNKIFDSSYFTVKQVDIVLENETYEDKTRLKVKYINIPGGMSMAGTTVQSAMGNVDMRSEIEAAKARLAAKGRTAPTPSTQEELPNFPSGRAPF
jgi:hypothetical protein